MTREERLECIRSLITDIRERLMSEKRSSNELSFLETELRLLTLIKDLEFWRADKEMG